MAGAAGHYFSRKVKKKLFLGAEMCFILANGDGIKQAKSERTLRPVDA